MIGHHIPSKPIYGLGDVSFWSYVAHVFLLYRDLTRPQILTGLLPYRAHNRDVSVISAIKSMELPADLSTVILPNFVRSVIERCWQKPELRPEIHVCRFLLSTQTRTLSEAFTKAQYIDLPPQFRTQGDGWTAIRNPDSPKTFAFDFVSDFSPKVGCVI